MAAPSCFKEDFLHKKLKKNTAALMNEFVKITLSLKAAATSFSGSCGNLEKFKCFKFSAGQYYYPCALLWLEALLNLFLKSVSSTNELCLEQHVKKWLLYSVRLYFEGILGLNMAMNSIWMYDVKQKTFLKIWRYVANMKCKLCTFHEYNQFYRIFI